MPVKAQQKTSGNTLVMGQPAPAAAQPAPAAAQPAPAAAQPAPAVTKPTPTPARTASRISQRELQTKRIFTYGILLLFGYGIWVIDGFFTVIGVISLVSPNTLIEFAIGIIVSTIFHLFISWGQHTFITGKHIFIRVLGLALLIINVLSNIYGLNLAAHWAFPTLTIPDPTTWIPEVSKVLSSKPDQTTIWSTGAAPAVIITISASLLAWYAEKIRDFFRDQWQESATMSF